MRYSTSSKPKSNDLSPCNCSRQGLLQTTHATHPKGRSCSGCSGRHPLRRPPRPPSLTGRPCWLYQIGRFLTPRGLTHWQKFSKLPKKC